MEQGKQGERKPGKLRLQLRWQEQEQEQEKQKEESFQLIAACPCNQGNASSHKMCHTAPISVSWGRCTRGMRGLGQLMAAGKKRKQTV